MTSLFGKLRGVVLGNAHSVLDLVIDMNSIAVVKQYIRDLETARTGIATQAAVAKGRVTTITVDITNKSKEVAEAKENIDLLISDDDPTNDTNAVTIQLQVDELELQIETLKGDLETAETLSANMTETLKKIDQKHTEMMGQVRTLEQQEATANASELAASAIETAGKLSNFDSGASVDNLQERIRARKATADARLEQALGDVSGSTENSVALARAKKAIEERKAALNKPAAAAE